MNRLYKPTPDGYCGDEDNGQTSAWYVFSAMGFYPVCPATDQYVMGSPLFQKITVRLPNKKSLIITAPNNDGNKPYVQAISWNGKVHDKNWISHFDLINGGTLQFSMESTPNQKRGTAKTALPFSLSDQP